MRYWCPECKSEYVVGEKPTPGYCTMVEDGGEECGEILVKLPDFETPEQYEKRTGAEYGDDWLVWVNDMPNDPQGWRVDYYKNALDDQRYQIVCVQSPEPPPDDWRPENTQGDNR